MKTLRLILLIAIVALSNNSAQSQDNQQQQISGTTNYSNVRKMEVIGYASVNIPPNEVYVSFTTKEFVDKFLAETDMKLLNNFSIESFDHNDINGKVRKLQISAFERGRDKADALLALYGEKRGKILDIQEMHCYITYPKTHGQKGNVHHIVSMTGGTQYLELPTNDLQDIKIEYQAKLVFEIITENNKK